MAAKEFMMPQTVPNRPMKGATAIAVRVRREDR